MKAQISWTGKTNVFIGDSNTEGMYNGGFNYGSNRFASVLSLTKGSIEDNRGISGKVVQDAATICETPKASESYIPTKTPDHLFLYIKLGSNDIAHNNGSFTPTEFKSRLGQLIEDARSKGWPSASIVLVSPPWAPVGSANEPGDITTISGAYDLFYDYCGITNRIDETRQQAYVDAVSETATLKSTVFIDLYTAMKNHPNRTSFISELNGGYDRIHLSTTGHQFVANLLADFPYPEALPLTLIDFSAQKKNNTVHLSWKSENEVNTKEFIIERSDNNQPFRQVGRVTANGHSTAQLFYEFTDEQPLHGNNLYRLKMVDLDGIFEYSKMIAVNIKRHFYSISPNPAKNNVTIVINKTGPVALQLINMAGSIVKKHNLPGGTHSISTSDLKKGLYLVRLMDSSETYIEKLIIE